jgi:hypothetical protein
MSETIDQRREREELVGNMADIIQMAAELQKRAASVMECIMLWNPPQEEQGEAPEPPKFTPLSPPPEKSQPACAVTVSPAPGPVQVTNAEPKVDLGPRHPDGSLKRTRRNRILDAWEQSEHFTVQAMAADLKMAQSDVNEILDRARQTKDYRVIAGDELRKREPKIPATVEKNPGPALDPEDEVNLGLPPNKDAPTIIKSRNGVSLPRVGLPKLPEDDDRKPPGWMPPLKGIPHDTILVVQPENRAVHGHKGYFRASKSTLDVMQRLSDGNMYPAQTLLGVGKYATVSDTLDRLKGLKPILGAIGVDLQINAGLVKLNRLED